MILGSITNPRSTGWQMYILTKSKSDSLLTKREIFTDRKDVTLFVDEIARENDSPSEDATEEKLYGVCLRTRDPRIRRGKPSFGKWGKLALLLIGQYPHQWLEKEVTVLEGKLLAGSVVRGRIDFSHLPVVGTKTIWLSKTTQRLSTPRAGAKISISLCAKRLSHTFTRCSLAALARKTIAFPKTNPSCLHFSIRRRFSLNWRTR